MRFLVELIREDGHPLTNELVQADSLVVAVQKAGYETCGSGTVEPGIVAYSIAPQFIAMVYQVAEAVQ